MLAIFLSYYKYCKYLCWLYFCHIISIASIYVGYFDDIVCINGIIFGYIYSIVIGYINGIAVNVFI